jgi:hypothetical protein
LESTCVNPPLHTESAAPPYLDTLCPCFQSIIWSSEASPTVHSLPSSTVSKIEIQIIADYGCFVEADWLLWNTLTTSLLSQIFGLVATSDPTYLDCSPIVNRGARGTFVSTHFSIWPLLFHWHLSIRNNTASDIAHPRSHQSAQSAMRIQNKLPAHQVVPHDHLVLQERLGRVSAW